MASKTPSLVARNFRRNYSLGVLNGALFGFADNLASPYLVLSPFVSALGGSHFLVGLLPAIYNGGWYFPQFMISHRLQSLPTKKGVYDAGAWVRVICWMLLTAATFIVPSGNYTLLLVLFFLFYILFSFAAGFTGAAFMDIVAKVVPVDRRGTFFGRRDLGAAIMAIAAGFLIHSLLDPQLGITFPLNFGVLFLVSGVGVTLALGSFHFVVEPKDKSVPKTVTFREQVGAARRVLKENHLYRRYLLTRWVLAISDIATPFYAVYATDYLKAPLEIVGTYIALATLSTLITNPILSRISDRRGHRVVVLCAGGAMVAMPLVALGLGLLAPGPAVGLPFGLVFVMNGIARTSGNIAFPSMLLEIAPAPERALYIGFTNTMLGVATFLPTLGGLLLDLAGYQVLFVLTLAIGVVGLWLAMGIGALLGTDGRIQTP